MKKIIGILVLTVFLAACASDNIEPLSEGDTPDPKKAVLIGKIELVPAMDEDGYAAKAKTKKFLDVSMAFRPASLTGYNPDKDNGKDDDLIRVYAWMQTNGFFAIEVDPQDKAVSYSRSFYVERTHFFSPDLHYNSHVREVDQVVDGKLEAGKVYYIGTLVIHLADKSFRSTGDQVYDKNDLRVVRPSAMTLKDEFAAASSWVKKEFPKMGPVQKAAVKLVPNNTKSKYREVSVSN